MSNHHSPEMDTDTGKNPVPSVNMEAGRRAFMRNVGLGAAGAAFLGGSAGLPSAAMAASADLDIEILNFALNLEYLEAEFYLHAIGRSLNEKDIRGIGPVGMVEGGKNPVPFKDKVIQDYAFEIANDEEAHVKALRGALGSNAVSRPKLNIGSAFQEAAIAAGLVGKGEPPFDAYKDDASFLLAAYIFEDVGVTAYNGAAPLITSKAYLAAAASILAVEAYHAGLIRTVLFAKGKLDTPSHLTWKETALISNLRGTLDGVGIDDQGVGPDQSTKAGGNATPSNIVPTDKNGLAFARTPRQVLNIVYGKANAKKGLFFPDGAHTKFDNTPSKA